MIYQNNPEGNRRLPSRAESRRQARAARRATPSAPLFLELRPLTTADMVTGVEYPPDLSILHIRTLPVFENGWTALATDLPVWLPAGGHRADATVEADGGVVRTICRRGRRSRSARCGAEP